MKQLNKFSKSKVEISDKNWWASIRRAGARPTSQDKKMIKENILDLISLKKEFFFIFEVRFDLT